MLHGSTYRTSIFPNDSLTVPDASQVTGKRVNFRVGIDYPACDSTNYSVCDAFAMLNKLDGFDLQPRVTIPFTGPIDVSSVNDQDVFIQGPGGRTQLMQLVWDPASNSLSGIANAMLWESSLYNIVVTSGLKDTNGLAIDACGSACIVPFTTRTATAELYNIRAALDDGSAYTAAGISDRHLSFTQNAVDDAFPLASVFPSVTGSLPISGIVRHDNAAISLTDSSYLVDSVVPNLVSAPSELGTVAFGSFMSPRYQYASAGAHEDNAVGNTDGVIPAIPTKQTEQPFGADRLGVILITPSGSPPIGGWPVAIYGPGFTRSKYDIFVTADYNAGFGVATIATDPAGHAYGPASTATVFTAANQPSGTTFSTFGRARDLNGDGCLADGLNDGVGPTDHQVVTGDCQHLHRVSDTPSRKPIDGLQSGLVQTAVDNMALLRSIQAGVTIPTISSTGTALSHDQIYYYGLSFGSIYGTMQWPPTPS